jgi:hypothetical protein
VTQAHDFRMGLRKPQGEWAKADDRETRRQENHWMGGRGWGRTQIDGESLAFFLPVTSSTYTYTYIYIYTHIYIALLCVLTDSGCVLC